VTDDRVLLIRRATLSDLDPILTIEEASFPTPWSRAVLASELCSRQGCYIVAEIIGQVVGYAGMSCFAGEAHIMNLAVDPDHRRCGIGEALLVELLGRAARSGGEMAYLEYRPSNAAAAVLYRKLGFRRAGRRPGYYRDTGEDAILMTLDDLAVRWSGNLSAYWRTWERRYGCRRAPD
jgi:ribosomal-protein-alanine N-acetyltransferase